MNHATVPESAMRRSSLIGVIILLAACGGEKRPEAGPPADSTNPLPVAATTTSVLLLCGADTVRVQGSDTEVQLHAHGETFRVVLTPSASGAKYQVADDSTTFYWNHGATSLVQVRGDLMPECEVVPGT
jgi:membrane-bound inhibitor of C-type lysozyme